MYVWYIFYIHCVLTVTKHGVNNSPYLYDGFKEKEAIRLAIEAVLTAQTLKLGNGGDFDLLLPDLNQNQKNKQMNYI